VFVGVFGQAAISVLKDLQRLAQGFGTFSKFALASLDPIGSALSAVTGKDIGLFAGRINAFGDRIAGTFDEFIYEAERANRLLSATPKFTDAQIKRYESLGNAANNAAKDTGSLTDALGLNADETEKTGKGTDALADKQKKLADRTKEAADALRDQMAAALDDAKKRLEDAQQAFDDMYQSTRDAALGALNLEDAFTYAGDNVAAGFVEELQEQADKTKGFSDRVKQLLDAGLSQSALRRVIAAGVERGTEIADAILGGAESVLKVNALVDTIENIANNLGLTTAEKFYQAGVDAAQSYLKGIEATVGRVGGLLDKAKTPADVKGAGALFSQGVSAASLTPAQAGNYNNYVIYAQSLNPALAGQQVVDALKAYERANGFIDITAAGSLGLVD
jgi:hypothetical protein